MQDLLSAKIPEGPIQERWDSYLKLEAELAHLERRLDKRAQAEERKRWRALSRFQREASRAKGRR